MIRKFCMGNEWWGSMAPAALSHWMGLSRKSVASTQKLRQIPQVLTGPVSQLYSLQLTIKVFLGGQRDRTRMLPQKLIPPFPHLWNLKIQCSNALYFYHLLPYSHICSLISCEMSTLLFPQPSFNNSALSQVLLFCIIFCIPQESGTWDEMSLPSWSGHATCPPLPNLPSSNLVVPGRTGSPVAKQTSTGGVQGIPP